VIRFNISTTRIHIKNLSSIMSQLEGFSSWCQLRRPQMTMGSVEQLCGDEACTSSFGNFPAWELLFLIFPSLKSFVLWPQSLVHTCEHHDDNIFGLYHRIKRLERSLKSSQLRSRRLTLLRNLLSWPIRLWSCIIVMQRTLLETAQRWTEQDSLSRIGHHIWDF
jgi:hypothetical protein